jgi:hypothetical protein
VSYKPDSTQRAFQSVITRLADSVDLTGDCDTPADLPALTEAEIAAVLRYEPTILADAVSYEHIIQRVTGSLTDDSPLITRASNIGAALIGSLAAQARYYVLDAVRAEIERRRVEADESRPLNSMMSPREQAADDCGVARLFSGSHR